MVTVNDVMRLPCMRNARVAAGLRGMGQRVAAVSVLEYSCPTPFQDDMFTGIEKQPDELIICAFMSIKDDVEAQCNVLRQLKAHGDIGILLYYVGVIMPRIDERLLAVADELDFVLICMPENDYSLRYSDAIQEITGAIFMDGARNSSFVTEMIKRMSTLPGSQRSMDIMLRMLSERTGASLALMDSSMRTLNHAGAPDVSAAQMDHALELIGSSGKVSGTAEGLRYNLCNIRAKNSNYMLLAVLQSTEDDRDIAEQAAETVELFANIWSERHGSSESAELLRAIIHDEPLLTHRLSQQLGVSLETLHGMLVAFPSRHENNLAHRLLAAAQRQFLPGQIQLGELFDGSVVLFVQRELFRGQHDFMDSIAEALHAIDAGAQLFACYYLPDISFARKAWILLEQQAGLTARLYPEHKWYSLQEAQFAAECSEILSGGENDIRRHLEALAPLDVEDSLLRRDMHHTLAVYLLDSGSSIVRTAEKLYLHRNTIKYRLGKISEDLGYRPDEMPEERELYMAVALERLLGL